MAEKTTKKEAKKAAKAQKKKKEEPSQEVTGGKIFTIPLRKAFEKSKKKRAAYSARLVRNYLKTHMKSDNIKLGPKLNEKLWERGMKKPPRRVRVRAIIDGDAVKVELMGYAYKDFKAKPKKEVKGMKDKLMDRLGAKALKKQEEEDKLSSAKTPEKAEKMVQETQSE